MGVIEALRTIRESLGDFDGSAEDNPVDVVAEYIERLEKRADHQYADSMIAHRWFERMFGQSFNGRDFFVKCPMAYEVIAAMRESRSAIESFVNTACGEVE